MDFELDTSGFDKLKKNLEKLEKKDKIKFGELFPGSFIKKYTQFETLEGLFEKSDYEVNTAEDFKEIPQDDWDKFIKNNTNFSNWEDMLGKARQEWIRDQLEFD